MPAKPITNQVREALNATLQMLTSNALRDNLTGDDDFPALSARLKALQAQISEALAALNQK